MVGSFDTTRKQLDQLWRSLSFWWRLAIEAFLCILIALLVEFSFSGRSGDFTNAILGGACFGLFYAIIEHAFFAGNRKR
jgi:H+/Cl- antiporter ClcA